MGKGWRLSGALEIGRRSPVHEQSGGDRFAHFLRSRGCSALVSATNLVDNFQEIHGLLAQQHSGGPLARLAGCDFQTVWSSPVVKRTGVFRWLVVAWGGDTGLAGNVDHTQPR